MIEFVGINLNTDTVECWGHKMASGTFYYCESDKVKIIDSLDELPNELQIFWYNR